MQAEEELIEILPTFTEGAVAALTGDLGPFRAGVPVAVPLWAALRLKADQRCRVVPPAWLAPPFLARAKAMERERADAFAPLPFYYIEVARLLLSSWCARARAHARMPPPWLPPWPPHACMRCAPPAATSCLPPARASLSLSAAAASSAAAAQGARGH